MLHTYDKKHPDFENLLFVARAAAKRNDFKPEQEQINITERHIQATDGHRAHRFTPEKMTFEPGMYRIMKKTKTSLELLKVETVTPYPNFERVLPKEPKLEEFLLKGDTDLKFATVMRRLLDPLACLSHAYFSDLFPSGVTSFAIVDGFSPAYFKGEHIEAIVMPLRQKQDGQA